MCARGCGGPVKASERGSGRAARRRGWKRESGEVGGEGEKKERKEGREREREGGREARKAEGRWRGVKREWV